MLQNAPEPSLFFVPSPRLPVKTLHFVQGKPVFQKTLDFPCQCFLQNRFLLVCFQCFKNKSNPLCPVLSCCRLFSFFNEYVYNPVFIYGGNPCLKNFLQNQTDRFSVIFEPRQKNFRREMLFKKLFHLSLGKQFLTNHFFRHFHNFVAAVGNNIRPVRNPQRFFKKRSHGKPVRNSPDGCRKSHMK